MSIPAELRVPFLFALSLAIGLLIGLERERRPEAKAGVRTFPLIALLGTTSALLTDRFDQAWILVAALALVGATLISAYAIDRAASRDAGTTTVIAALVCFALGAVLWFEHVTLALGLAIATTALLHFKTELEGFSHKLTPRDVVSALQFAALSFVILPLLPDRGYGPYAALNPYHVWWMVVLISGVSWLGYVAWRLAGPRHGAALVGLLGGLVSSTATTLVYARASRSETGVAAAALVIIVVANLVVVLRMFVLALAVAPDLVAALAPALGGALTGGIPYAAALWLRHQSASTSTAPDFTNPTQLRVALAFSGGYAVVLVAAAWLADVAGANGLYALAIVSGLTDVDAITLTGLRLYDTGAIVARTAVTLVTLALAANLLFKTVLVFLVGGAGLGRRCLPAFAVTAIGAVLGLVWSAGPAQ